MKTQSLKVSITIPVYNAEDYLRRCLDSIATQTLVDIEIVCVDDGSPDNSGKILDEYAERDPRFKIIHQANQGVFAARNIAIKRAKGEYVIFIDPDDFYPEDKTLEKLYQAAHANNAQICGGSFSAVESDGTLTTRFDDTWFAGYTFKSRGWQDYADYQFDFGYHRFLYSTQMLLKHGILFPPFSRYQDPPFFLRAMVCAKKFYHIPDVVYRYQNSDNTTIKWNTKKLIDRLGAAELMLTIAKQNNLRKLYALTLSRVSLELHWMVLTEFPVLEVLDALARFYKVADFDFAFGAFAPFNVNLMDSVNLYRGCLKTKTELEGDLAKAKADLKTIEQSTSWKITKPLRRAGIVARKVARRS